MEDQETQLLWTDYKTVRLSGNSLVVGLPAPFVRKARISKGDRVKLTYTETSITITKLVEPKQKPN